jgi:hypothetical protein
MRKFTMERDNARVACIELVYSIDWGIEESVLQEQGAIFGRNHAYGTVIYGVGVGPIQAREHRVTPMGDILQDPVPEVVDIIATLR